jgi:hypothetical protein
MRLAAYLILNILSIQFLAAQHDWWPIHPGQVNYFKLDTSNLPSKKNKIFGIHITNNQPIVGGIRYHFNHTFNLEDQPEKDCIYSVNANLLGKYMDVLAESIVLYSTNNTAIQFRKDAHIGDSVIVHFNTKPDVAIVIKLVRQETMNLYGVNDSVRVYGLYSINYPSQLSDTFVLSKQFGFIRTPNIHTIDRYYISNFYHYLNIDWHLPGMFQLVAHSNIIPIQLKSLTYLDCFTFEPRDIHHYKESSIKYDYGKGINPSITTTTNKIIIETIKNKDDYRDSVVYEIVQRFFKSKEVITAFSYDLQESVDTNTFNLSILKTTHLIDTVFPGTFYYRLPNSIFLFARINRYENDGIEQLPLNHLRHDNDTCLGEIPDATRSTNSIYVRGLGGPYYDFSRGNDDYSEIHERKLIYYNKSTGTWGTPYPFPLSVNEHNGSKKNAVKCYPNPAKQNFTIESKEVQSITITDITGKIVYENQQAEPTTTVTCKEWPAGIYFVKCSSANFNQIEKIVVQHSN